MVDRTRVSRALTLVHVHYACAKHVGEMQRTMEMTTMVAVVHLYSTALMLSFRHFENVIYC